MQSIDPSLIVTALGILVSIASAAAIVRQKLASVIEQIQDMEKRLRKSDTRIDKGEVHQSTSEQRVSVLSSMLSPERRQVLHERLARLEANCETLRRDVDAHRKEYLSAHNGRHPPVPSVEEVKTSD